PGVDAGRDRDGGGGLEVHALLLLEPGAEMEDAAMDDADQRRDVRAAVWADGREPVELRLREGGEGVRPGRRAGVRIAEARVDLWRGHRWIRPDADARIIAARSTPAAPALRRTRPGARGRGPP